MKKEHGVSLVELLLVVAAVGFVVLLIANLPSAVSSINKSRRTSIAKEIAGRQMDSLRKQGYTVLSTQALGVHPFTDSALAGLSSSSAGYELLTCPAEVCPEGGQILEVKVKVDWNESGDSKMVELVTLVSQGGIGQ